MIDVPRVARVVAGIVAVAIVALVVTAGQGIVVGSGTTRYAIPASCHQPSTVDYSHVPRPDYGPYVVKLASWRELPWGSSSHAVVGHGLTADRSADYGVFVELTSTEIERFECRWTDEGVTIIEPPAGPATSAVEHVVPAMSFLGGR